MYLTRFKAERKEHTSRFLPRFDSWRHFHSTWIFQRVSPHSLDGAASSKVNGERPQCRLGNEARHCHDFIWGSTRNSCRTRSIQVCSFVIVTNIVAFFYFFITETVRVCIFISYVFCTIVRSFFLLEKKEDISEKKHLKN